MTCEDTPNATSLLAPDSGPLQLDLLDGPTIAPSGPLPAPAKVKASRASVSVPMIQGICGRTYIESSVPSGPLELWESRLRQRLALIGSTECALTWRAKATPHGRSISRLAPSMRHTNGTASGGSLWPTPKSSAAGPDFAKVERSDTGLSLQTVMAATTYWPTPKASAAGETSRSGARKDEPLMGGLMRMAVWPTPTSLSFKDSHQPGNCNSMNRMMELAQDTKLTAETVVGGPTPNGLRATTTKRGAPNPEFPCWLMGWPAELVFGALRGIQSFRSSRPKSSRRSPKLKPA
jgi:hypothetical protein